MSKLKYYNGSTWKTVNGEITGDTLPIGSIVEYGSLNAPTNWLICDGSAVSRTDYAELFAVIGTSFGAGNGSTTFNLPDFRTRVPAGYKASDSDFNAISKTGGEKTHTLTTNEMPSHNHMEKIYSKNYNDNKSLSGNRAYARSFADVTGGWNYTVNGETGGQIVDLIESGNSGSGQAHNNLQPYLTVRFIIKAKQSSGVIANVSNTVTSSTTDTYSCDYINSALNGTLLYLSTGEATTITLNEDIDNYNYVEIYYYTNDSGSMCCKKAQINKNATTLMCLDFTYNTGILYYKMANVSISDTSIVFNNNAQMVLGTDTSPTSGTYIYIFKVIGYK